MDSTSIVNDLKMMLDETAQMTDEEIREQIIQIAATYNVNLTENQINQLISLCRSLEGLDADGNVVIRNKRGGVDGCDIYETVCAYVR